MAAVVIQVANGSHEAFAVINGAMVRTSFDFPTTHKIVLRPAGAAGAREPDDVSKQRRPLKATRAADQ